jgi:hypothetical protein
MRATNISFSRIIKLGDRLREFNFRKIPGTNNYTVNVTDDKGQRILFTLRKNPEGSWMMEGVNLPLWLQFSERRLGGEIEEPAPLVTIFREKARRRNRRKYRVKVLSTACYSYLNFRLFILFTTTSRSIFCHLNAFRFLVTALWKYQAHQIVL